MKAKAVASILLVLIGVLALPSIAGAAALHLFSKVASVRLTDSRGHRLNLNKVRIVKGDRLDEIDVDYRGTAARHSGRPIGSDHLGCVVITLADTVCDSEIALGGSMLISDEFRANFTLQNPFTSVPISAGTGRYAGAQGILTIGPVGTTNNANFTIIYRQRG